MFRYPLYLAALGAIAYTAYVHNVLAGVFAGTTGLFVFLYIREVDFVDGLMYIKDNLLDESDKE